ncbi:MAG: tripartite tricarboxylate transporter substrate-binding protein [Thermodesulfobacteriota bacterium]
MLAVTVAEQRYPDFPDIPTLKDLGYKDVSPAVYLLAAPKGLPDPIFKKIETVFTQAAHAPDFKKVLLEICLFLLLLRPKVGSKQVFLKHINFTPIR